MSGGLQVITGFVLVLIGIMILKIYWVFIALSQASMSGEGRISAKQRQKNVKKADKLVYQSFKLVLDNSLKNPLGAVFLLSGIVLIINGFLK